MVPVRARKADSSVPVVTSRSRAPREVSRVRATASEFDRGSRRREPRPQPLDRHLVRRGVYAEPDTRVTLGDELIGRRIGNDPAAVEDRDPIGQLLDVGDVVRRQQDRPPLVAQARHQLPRRPSCLRVHARRRLVEDEDLGVAGEGDREREARALPAGEPSNPRGRDRPERDAVDELTGGRPAVVERDMQLDEVASARPRLESCAALEHQSDARSQGGPAGAWIVPEHPDRATVGGPVALDSLDRRGLAGPIRPKEHHELARADRKVHAVENRPAAIRLAEACDLDQLPAGAADPIGVAGAVGAADPVAPGRISAYCCSNRSAVTSPTWIARRIPSASMKYDCGRATAR